MSPKSDVTASPSQEPARPVSTDRPTGTKPSAESKASSAGLKSLGKYQIVKRIGAGGMGTVYLARDTTLKRTVALKILPQDKAENPTLVRRFLGEAQAAAQLTHKNIVTVFENGEIDGHLYIAMEYVEGIDVHELIARRGVLPVKRSIEIVKQVTRALEHAHSQGIVHRDIKPSNLLIKRDGTVKLTDLGLARCVDDMTETSITRAGTTVGTVDYMAPEQARNSKLADIRSDLYSLGCTWYQMLTGSAPFPEGSLTNKLQAHATKAVPDPRTANETVTEALICVLNRLMAKKPEDRYQTPSELLEDLNSSSLVREAVSQEILAALAESPDSEARAEAPAREPHALPPKRVPVKKADSDTESDKRADPQFIKYALIVGGSAAAVIALAMLVSNLANVFDSPAAGTRHNPFASDPEPVDSVPGISALPGGAQARGSGGDGRPTRPTPNSDPSAQETAIGSTAGQRQVAPERPQLDPRAIPAWSNDPWVPTQGVQLTVGGKPATTNSETLSAALLQLGPQGGVIHLLGDGLFHLPAIHLQDVERVVITGTPDARPIVALDPGVPGPEGAVLAVSNGSLVLNGLHLTLDATQFPGPQPVTMVSVSGGDLSVVDCSASLLETRAGPTNAFAVSGTLREPKRLPANASRVLLDRSFVRGNGLTSLKVDQPASDVLLRETVLASGQAPALLLAGEASAAADPEAVARAVRLQGSTVCATRVAVACSAQDPPPTVIVTESSLFCTGPQSESAVLCAAEEWPLTDDERAGRPDDLQWISHGCRFVGFKTLVDLGQSPPQSVADWERLWDQQVDNDQFVSDAWPGKPIGDFGQLAAATLDGHALPAAIRGAEDPPGAPVDRLQVPEPAIRARLLATAHRPRMPTALIDPLPAAKTIRVDLTEEDLGSFLTRTNWPDDTLVVATGSGSQYFSPFKIQGKRLRIQFVQQSGPQLTLLPKATRDSRAATALITVEKGYLELTGATIEVPTTRRQVPNWFLLVRDGSFALRGCKFRGPTVDSTEHEGLIRWEFGAGTARATAPSGGNYPHYGYLSGCFLVDTGNLIRGDLDQSALIMHNCVMVARGKALDLGLASAAGAAAVEIRRSTFSATDAAIALSGAGGDGVAARIFVDDSVFAPPFVTRSDDAPHPAVLVHRGSALGGGRFEWWGGSNGFSTEIKHFIRPDPGSPPDEETGFKTWEATWGEGHEQRALTRAGDVVLAEGLPTRVTQLTPRSFALRPDSKAATWAAGGQPIGAVVIFEDDDATDNSEQPRSPASRRPQF